MDSAVEGRREFLAGRSAKVVRTNRANAVGGLLLLQMANGQGSRSIHVRFVELLETTTQRNALVKQVGITPTATATTADPKQKDKRAQHNGRWQRRVGRIGGHALEGTPVEFGSRVDNLHLFHLPKEQVAVGRIKDIESIVGFQETLFERGNLGRGGLVRVPHEIDKDVRFEKGHVGVARDVFELGNVVDAIHVLQRPVGRQGLNGHAVRNRKVGSRRRNALRTSFLRVTTTVLFALFHLGRLFALGTTTTTRSLVVRVRSTTQHGVSSFFFSFLKRAYTKHKAFIKEQTIVAASTAPSTDKQPVHKGTEQHGSRNVDTGVVACLQGTTHHHAIVGKGIGCNLDLFHRTKAQTGTRSVGKAVVSFQESLF